MLNISEQAVEQLKEFRERRGPQSCVRVGILSGSTTGPSLGISVDEKTDKDDLFDFDGLDVIIDSALMAYSEKIDIEYIQKEGAGCSSGGFKIIAKNSL